VSLLESGGTDQGGPDLFSVQLCQAIHSHAPPPNVISRHPPFALANSAEHSQRTNVQSLSISSHTDQTMPTMQIRYSCSDLSALCAAYTALISVPPSEIPNIQLSIPRKRHPNNLREVDRRAVFAILFGNMCIGFSVIAGLPQYIVLGSMINIVGGSLLILASLGEIMGYFDWAHYRARREEREDLARLYKTMEATKVSGRAGEEVVELVKGRKRVVELNTAHGFLVTAKTDTWAGYEVILRREKEEVCAQVEWVGKDGIRGVGDDEWVKELDKLVEGAGEGLGGELIRLYQ
jgi:hypothetical protein